MSNVTQDKQIGSLDDDKVNVASGKINFNLPLLQLSRRYGSPYVLNLSYSDFSLKENYSTWNKEIGTGALGIGFSLNTSNQIIKIGDAYSYKYHLLLHDQIYQLEWDKTEGSIDYYRTVTSTNYIIKYVSKTIGSDLFTSQNYWEVIDEQGQIYVFGYKDATGIEKGTYDASKGTYSEASDEYKNIRKLLSNPNTSTDIPPNVKKDNTVCSPLNISVRWNGWYGISTEVTAQSNVVDSWNLSQIIDEFDNKIVFSYIQHVAHVANNNSSKIYTIASYVYKISSITNDGYTDGYISLEYADKDTDEYFERQSIQARPNGVQSKFTKLYVSRVNLIENNVPKDSKQFIYSDVNTTPGDVTLQSLIKRQLTEIKNQFKSGSAYVDILPSNQFEYYGNTSEDNEKNLKLSDKGFDKSTHRYYSDSRLYGHLKSYTDSSGIKTVYKYKEMNLSNVQKQVILPNTETLKTVHSGYDYSILVTKSGDLQGVSIVQWTITGWKKTVLCDHQEKANFLGSIFECTEKFIAFTDLGNGVLYLFGRDELDAEKWNKKTLENNTFEVEGNKKVEGNNKVHLSLSDDRLSFICPKKRESGNNCEYRIYKLVDGTVHLGTYEPRYDWIGCVKIVKDKSYIFIFSDTTGSKTFSLVGRNKKYRVRNFVTPNVTCIQIDHKDNSKVETSFNKLPTMGIQYFKDSETSNYKEYHYFIGSWISSIQYIHFANGMLSIGFYSRPIGYSFYLIDDILYTGLVCERQIVEKYVPWGIVFKLGENNTTITLDVLPEKFKTNQNEMFKGAVPDLQSSFSSYDGNIIYSFSLDNGSEISSICDIYKYNGKVFKLTKVDDALNNKVSRLSYNSDLLCSFYVNKGSSEYRVQYYYYNQISETWTAIETGDVTAGQVVNLNQNTDYYASVLYGLGIASMVFSIVLLPFGLTSIAGILITATFAGLAIAESVTASMSTQLLKYISSATDTNFSQSYIMEESTIWFSGDNQSRLTAIGGTGDNSRYNCLGSDQISGDLKIVRDGQIYNFVPFYIGDNLYYRNLQNGTIGNIMKVNPFSIEGSSDIYMQDNTLQVIKGKNLISLRRASGQYSLIGVKTIDKNVDAVTLFRTSTADTFKMYFSGVKYAISSLDYNMEKLSNLLWTNIENGFEKSQFANIDAAFQAKSGYIYLFSQDEYEYYDPSSFITTREFLFKGRGKIKDLFKGISFDKIDCITRGVDSEQIYISRMDKVIKYETMSANSFTEANMEISPPTLDNVHFTYDTISYTYASNNSVNTAFHRRLDTDMMSAPVDYAVDSVAFTLNDQATTCTTYYDYDTNDVAYNSASKSGMYKNVIVTYGSKEGTQ